MVLRPDWNNVKLVVMRFGIKSKFTSNPDLRQQLRGTGNNVLIEGNYWHDNIWGDCKCSRCTAIPGRNYLGTLLMNIREDILLGKY